MTKTSTVSDIFMNLFVFPYETRKLNKQGGSQNKLRGGSPKTTKIINVSPTPIYFEPESNDMNTKQGYFI